MAGKPKHAQQLSKHLNEGLPARTLDSKIKRFKINKYRFKVQRAS